MATELGTVVGGKYQILREVGRGGMSVVYYAMDTHLNSHWAVKEVRKTSSTQKNEVVINSLLAEKELMKKLSHPALPRIVDFIEDQETIYVVMDFIEGRSLDKIIKEHGAQPADAVIEWAKQLCDVLDYLHSKNVIYRDMKPANVMLKPDGNVVLFDFGIAREYKEQNLADTTILGTKGYAPPEQFGSRQTDARSDIYALGMTMQHLLTGIDPRNPNYEFHPVREYNPEVSAGLESIINKCVAIDPDDRYQNCGELLYALQFPEEEVEIFKKRQKRKLTAFIVMASISILMVILGLVGLLLAKNENNKNYDYMINISTSTPYETKVETYTRAIDLFGDDTRAYIKLLEAYEDNNLFGDTESKQFTGKYNENQDAFDMTTTDYLDLSYKAGVTYLYLYSGGDNTFRTRILKSYPYFYTISGDDSETKNTSYKNYSVSKSYEILGDFYKKYVVSATSVKEPTKEAYEQLLSSLNVCITNLDKYDSDDAAYIKLTTYQEIENLIATHTSGLAKTGVDKQKVTSILSTVIKNTKALSVTQAKSLEIRDEIIGNYAGYVDDINRAYTNAAERSGK